jgi:hypothetical protein
MKMAMSSHIAMQLAISEVPQAPGLIWGRHLGPLTGLT